MTIFKLTKNRTLVPLKPRADQKRSQPKIKIDFFSPEYRNLYRTIESILQIRNDELRSEVSTIFAKHLITLETPQQYLQLFDSKDPDYYCDLVSSNLLPFYNKYRTYIEAEFSFISSQVDLSFSLNIAERLTYTLFTHSARVLLRKLPTNL